MSEVPQTPPDAELSPQEITSRSGSNFLAGFVCLDVPRREAMTVVYAFCRVVDDAVDDAPDPETARGRLAFWREELRALQAGEAKTPVGVAVRKGIDDFAIPAERLEDLVAGCAMDLDPSPIADQEELELYCYRVAAAVGLACLPVLGASSEGAQRFAHSLGHALQLTNVLRDLRGDAEIGRCYVPVTWLEEFGLQASDLLGLGDAKIYEGGGGVSQLCERLATRAAKHFADARSELHKLPRRQRRALVAARIMGAVYGDLLRHLVKRGGNLLAPRTRVPKFRKMWLALSVWLGVRA